MRRTLTIACTTLLAAISIASGPSAPAAFPGSNGDIVFGRSTHRQGDLWLVDPDTGRFDFFPDWQPV